MILLFPSSRPHAQNFRRFPLVFFHAIRVKIRDEGFVGNKGRLNSAWHSPEWHEGDTWHLDRATEGAKFWPGVMNELKNRAIGDILIPSSMA
jgi:putative transposase